MRAIVLSGGGANGEYQVGALQYIYKDLGIQHDIIIGTSVGTLNGAAIAQFPKGQEKEASEFLTKEVWNSVRQNSDIYRRWYHGFLWNIPYLWKRSVYCTEPLKHKIKSQLDPEKLQTSGKHFRAVGVSWNTGEKILWTEKSPDVQDGIYASASFPVMFEDAYVNGQWITDGGLRDIAAVGLAAKLGADTIDVISCSPRNLPALLGKPKALQKVTRGIEITLNEILRNDLARAEDLNRLCKAGLAPDKKHLRITSLQPSTDLGDSLDFSREKNLHVRGRGNEDARLVAWPT